MIADQMNIIWSEGMLDYLNDRYPGSANASSSADRQAADPVYFFSAEAKFKAAVNATYNPIVNPYKYGKGE
jgi:hypothetical protein